MSRLAKKGVDIPQGTTVSVEGTTVSVKGPHGDLSRSFPNTIGVEVADGHVSFEARKKTLETKAMIGTVAAHVRNMVSGVNTKFEKKLMLEGIGYKSELKGDTLVFALGFSHPVEVKVPQGLSVTVEKNVITISGINKEDVGAFAAKVRALKEPEPYKGKGLRYEGEVIKIKQGKKSA